MGEEVNPILFYILSALIIISALMVVRVRNMFYAALCLGMTFFGVAGIYVTLKAEFLAGMQILIYVGAIIVLVLFAVMLTTGIQKKELTAFNKIQGLAFVTTFVSILMVLLVVFHEFWNGGNTHITGFSTREIGEHLMRNYLIPFEFISVLLLAALIGAIVIARKERMPGGDSTLESSAVEKEGGNA